MPRYSVIAPLMVLAAAMVALPVFLPLSAQAAEEPSSNQIAENYAALLESDYVYPDTGLRYAAAIRAGIASGRYAALTGAALGEAIDADLHAVSPDGHLRLRVPQTVPMSATDGPGQSARPVPMQRPPRIPIEQSGWIAPDIAFIRFNLFPGDADVTAAAAKFMADHADARAIIFDIRTHGGGALDQMDVIFPWLFDKPTRLVTMATRASVDAAGNSPLSAMPSIRPVDGAPGMVTREHWAMPNGDARLRDAKIYVLTSGASASAAEHFALAMKHSGRGVLVGSATAGANHFGGSADLGGGYAAFIPVGRTYDPVTGQDWEGAGVMPDIAVAPADALIRALTELGVEADEAQRLSDAHRPTAPMERRRPRPVPSRA